MDDGRKQLYAALVKAQGIASAVTKDSKNDFHKYKYASAEDMIAEARASLSEAGLAFFPIAHDVIQHAGDSVEDELHVCYLLVHSSGESIEVKSKTPVIPEKGRPADKAVATAKTYDLGYTLRGLLLLPRVEKDAQADGRDDRGHTPRRDRAPQQTQAQRHVPPPATQSAPAPAPAPASAGAWDRLEAAASLAGGRRALLDAIEWEAWPQTDEDAEEALALAKAAHRKKVREQQSKGKAEGGQDKATGTPPPDALPPGSPPPSQSTPPPVTLSVVPNAGSDHSAEVRTVSAGDLSALVRDTKWPALRLKSELAECFGKGAPVSIDALKTPADRLAFAEHVEDKLRAAKSAT